MTDRLKTLFEEAVEMAAGDRAGFVALACADDPRLRDRLLNLLRAHERAGDFLEHPTGLVEAAALEVAADGDDLEPGQRIGNFTLQSRIGRGGFGSVWRASQEHPVARDVALKVLHPGFDAGRLAMRFLAECRTLARMQHASIAKVFDAGTEESGRPWLAMELVEGRPITQHCADALLGWRERVELLVEVCAAVQHAHSKAIVHRDLKPSNVMVTMRDGRAHPVVIDFGVARDLDFERRTKEVEAAQPLGTLDYMSPEQTVESEAGVDTRTDVYSLGVLLYELTARSRPFERPGEPGQPGERAAEPGDARELLRRIREEMPPPPSERSGAVARLPREVDWIAARAMAKDPAARYQTAAELADDLRRLLVGQAVLAAPAGALYRLRKFVRRHWLPAALGVAMILSLGVVTFVAARGWIEASENESKARIEQTAAERETRKANRALHLLDELWEAADPARFGRGDYQVSELFADFERELPRRVAGEPAVELRVRLTLGKIHRILGMLDRAEQHTRRAVELARTDGDPVVASECLLERARTELDRGDAAAAEQSIREAMLMLVGATPDDARRANLLEALASCRQRQGDTEDALLLATEALELREESCGPELIARSLLQIANLHGTVGRIDVAMEPLQRALDELDSMSLDHPDAITALQHLAILQQRKGDFASAEASHRESLRRRRDLYGDGHPQVAWAETDLAWALHELGRDKDAEVLLRGALPVLRARLGERHHCVTEAMQRLGLVLVNLRQLDESGTLLAEAVERFRTLPGHPIDGLVGCLGNLATQQWGTGDRELARETMTEAVEIARRELPKDHYVVSVNMTNLAAMLVQLGDTAMAEELLVDALERSTAAGRVGEMALQQQRLEQLRRR